MITIYTFIAKQNPHIIRVLLLKFYQENRFPYCVGVESRWQKTKIDLFHMTWEGATFNKVHILHYHQYIKIFLVWKEIMNICFKLQVQMYLSNFNCDASCKTTCFFWLFILGWWVGIIHYILLCLLGRNRDAIYSETTGLTWYQLTIMECSLSISHIFFLSLLGEEFLCLQFIFIRINL